MLLVFVTFFVTIENLIVAVPPGAMLATVLHLDAGPFTNFFWVDRQYLTPVAAVPPVLLTGTEILVFLPDLSFFGPLTLPRLTAAGSGGTTSWQSGYVPTCGGVHSVGVVVSSR